jgi:hypothetical protein
MLYFKNLPIENYYNNNKIVTLLKYNQEGIFYRNYLIPYKEMIVCVNRRGNYVLTCNRIIEPVVLGFIDL